MTVIYYTQNTLLHKCVPLGILQVSSSCGCCSAEVQMLIMTQVNFQSRLRKIRQVGGVYICGAEMHTSLHFCATQELGTKPSKGADRRV